MKLKRRKHNVKQRLRCYDREIEKYKYLYRAYITVREAKRVIELLDKHFRIKPKVIGFNYKSKFYGGSANYDGVISFRTYRLNLGIVCHELRHLFCYKNKIYGHNSKFYTNLNKFMEFIENSLSYYIKIKLTVGG